MSGVPKVYSERFCQYYGDATTTNYTVPAGKRALIKNLTAFNGGVASANIGVGIGGKLLWASPIPGGNNGSSVNVFLVAYQGEVVSVYTLGNSMGFALSGYLLSMV